MRQARLRTAGRLRPVQETDNPQDERPHTKAEIAQAAQDCFQACFLAADTTKCAAMFGARLMQYQGWTVGDAAEMVMQAIILLKTPGPPRK